MITETDKRVLGQLSTGAKRAAEVGAACFAPAGCTGKALNHYILVAGGHLRRLEKQGLVRRIRTGKAPAERTTWELARPSERELF